MRGTLERGALVKTDLLDVSEGGIDAADAVHIPFSELPSRLFELPSPRGQLRIIENCPEAALAIEFLRKGGRRVTPSPRWLCVGRGQGEGEGQALRLWSPNEYVEQALANYPPGRVLDLGCGSGRDLVYLGDRGWTGVGVDHLRSAIEQGRLLAARYGVSSVSFSSEIPPEQFDLCLLLFVPIRELLPMVSANQLILEGFTAQNYEKHGKPARQFQVSQDDLAGFEIVDLDESWRENGTHTLRAYVTQ